MSGHIQSRPNNRPQRTKTWVELQKERIAQDVVNAQRSVDALAPVMTANEVDTSPQFARSLQATENVWRRIKEEFGLLDSSTTAVLLGAKATNRNFASSRRLSGKLLGILRSNSYVFPGFQFSFQRGEVLPVIEPLISLARKNHWTDEDLTLWIVSPTTWFGPDTRPADQLDDTDAVLAAARDAMESLW